MNPKMSELELFFEDIEVNGNTLDELTNGKGEDEDE